MRLDISVLAAFIAAANCEFALLILDANSSTVVNVSEFAE